MTPDESLRRALALVEAERRRQDAKWGSQRSHLPRTWLPILMEEVGEVAKAMLERDRDGYVAELVQSAAVAVAAIEAELCR